MSKKENSLGINKSPKDTKIVVAMSGGVDSSTVAGMMKKEGYNVVGITLKLYDDTKETAKSKQDITIRLINPMDSAIYTTAYTDVVKYYSGGNHYWFPLVHQHQDASAFNSFKLYMSSGTLSGRFTVYGVQV